MCSGSKRVRGSVAISTYQAGKLLLVGWLGDRASLLARHFAKPMGFEVRGDRLVLATRHEVTVFQNCPMLAHDYIHDQPGRYDALFLPRTTYHTADLHTHDIAATESDIWLVNTRFSCLSTLSEAFTFVPRWRPSFVSAIVPEDRCHLNGLALRDGRPAYVTALGETDTRGGWRENKITGGIVIDVERNEIILHGLAMPHSPRWHDGNLWLLNSGEGQLLRLDVASGETDVICELPGYLRGLTFVGRHALVGLCKIREAPIFGGMPVETRYPKLACGVAVVDIERGRQVGFIEFTSGCTEIYDVRFLPGVLRPNILNLDKEATRHAVTAAPDLFYWLRPENKLKEDSALRESAAA